MDEMQELLNEFIAEAQDLFARIRVALGNAKSGKLTGDDFNEVARAVHTIKGGSSMFGLEDVMKRAHNLETYLEKFKDHPQKLNGKALDSVIRYLDKMETLIEGGGEAQGDTAEVAQSNLKDVNPETSKAPEPEPSSPQEKEPSRKAVGHQTQDIIRVPVDRIQKSLDTITEVFLLRNQMSFLVESTVSKASQCEGFLQEWEALDNALRKSIGELEHVTMSMRMMPVKSLFQRMEKTVRAYTETTNKSITVEIAGEDTELDKKVMDHLAEPLIHLIRNSMDHGIENPEARKALGKPETGVISLRAELRGNEVLIIIEDDGKGINHEAILKSAQNKGIDTSHIQTPEQAVSLIFTPGFSTAEAVTDVSGRGVGMDAVKSFVEGVGGSIDVSTQINHGTTFTLTLPLGMSLIPAIIVRINQDKYAISSSDILETIKLPYSAVLENAGQLYLNYNNQLLPFYSLDRYFSKAPARVSLNVVSPRVPVCIIRNHDELIALSVSEFIANTEIATRPLPAYAPKIAYVTGASILVTGEPVMVLSLRKVFQWITRKDEQTTLADERDHAAA